MKFTAGGEPTPDTQTPRYFHIILLGIALLSLIPRLSLGIHQYIEYDGYWHVWIAQQDLWTRFIREYQSNAHPPLYFLLLKAAFWFGRTNLTYRAISLASGTASVYVAGLIAMRAMRSPLWAALAALAYGLALPSILISNEVRTYMLSAFFIQVSFLYFLDLMDETAAASLRSRILFALMATLGCLSEYYALIYVGAALLFVLLLHLVRRRQDWLVALGREVLTFALILVLPAWEYISHFEGEPKAYNHLPDFYFDPNGAESAADFLLRNLCSELNCFSPWQIPAGAAFYAVLGGLILLVVAIFFLARRWSVSKNLAAAALLIFPLVMMGAIMFGAVARVYPFGGFLRQQYVLFPFFVIWPFLLPDRLLTAVPRAAGLAIAGILAVAIGAVSFHNYREWPKDSTPLFSSQMSHYQRLFPAPAAIYIDQFDLIGFFIHRNDWNWRFVSPVPASATVDAYRLARDGHSMMLFRDRDQWNFDLREAYIYSELAKGMRAWHLPSATIFCMKQLPPDRARTDSQVAGYRARIAEMSAAQGLCVQTLELDNYDVYAEFRTAGTCTAQQP